MAPTHEHHRLALRGRAAVLALTVACFGGCSDYAIERRLPDGSAPVDTGTERIPEDPAVRLDPESLFLSGDSPRAMVYVWSTGQATLLVSDSYVEGELEGCLIDTTSLGTELAPGDIGAMSLACPDGIGVEGALLVETNDPAVPVASVAITGETLSASIESPADGGSLEAESQIELIGLASGLEDPSRLTARWWSSLDGDLGSTAVDEFGESRLNVTLSTGPHEINFEVATIAGRVATDTVDVVVDDGPEVPVGDAALVMSYNCVDPRMIGDVANADTELDAVSDALTDVGLGLDVYWEDASGLASGVNLTGYRLVMATGCGVSWQSYSVQAANTLVAAKEAGAALMLFGDDAAYTHGVSEWNSLLLTSPTADNGYSGAVAIGSDRADPVTGAWGAATDFSYYYDVDTATPLDDGERVLATRGSDPVWIVREDPDTGQRSAMLIAGLAACDHGAVGSSADIDALARIFRNTVAWLVGS